MCVFIISTFVNFTFCKSYGSTRYDIDFDFIAAFDLERMADSAIANQLFDAAVVFLEKLVKKSEEEINIGILRMDNLFHHKVELQKYRVHLNATKKEHDYWLDKRGQYGIERRCNQYPFDPVLRKKKKFKKGYNATLINSRRLVKYFNMAINEKGNTTKMDEYQISTQLQVDKLCRGGQLRVM